ncbi:uncharacterized protein ATNIH1004_007297 [Aspergillus tanneri]|nr:uncharacterized protein ATNIH1004_007297 [Aspergillus tanneri]KAA8645876.1 hypothetical protein ATNIH1004_007297 [Aspergillus tanneri]
MEPTSELSDTGFYRQRAELAAYASRELINVPLSQRQKHQHQQQPRLRQSERTSTSPSPTPIVTADGVMLAANLNWLGPEEDGVASGKDHVKSFMEYDPAADSKLPADGEDQSRSRGYNYHDHSGRE